jgi:hypothetical protein
MVNHQVQSISSGSKPPPQLRHACHAQLHGSGAARRRRRGHTTGLLLLLLLLLLGELRGLLAISSGMLRKTSSDTSVEASLHHSRKTR